MSEALKNLKVVPGSKIMFFKNGESQGEAFTDINAGAYYPAISIFKNATVSVNFGPNFKYQEVEEEFKCRGVSINRGRGFGLLDHRVTICTSRFSADVRSRRRADL